MLDILPSAFTLTNAREAGLRKDQIYGLLAEGQIERIGRGVFVKAGELDPAFESLAAATAVQPASTMCLTSALVYHGLSDDIPTQSDIALPRGARHPAGFEHVSWHSFDPDTFLIGRDELDGNVGLFIYSAERTVIDTFRLAHQVGMETAVEAFQRWVRQRGNYPAKLLEMSESFPKAYRSLRKVLEILG